jgi:predicted XRE-type DNA-binding protein
MTEEKAALAKYLVFTKRLYQHKAAARLGINQGRVCEVITGKRFSNVPIPTPDQVPPELR